MSSLNRTSNAQRSIATATLLSLTGGVMQAAVLEVGAGKTYDSIQAAWDDAASNDTINVYPGVYGNGGAVLRNRGGQGDPGKSNITVQAVGDGKAIINGSVWFFGTLDGNEGGHTLDGFYIDFTDGSTAGIQVRADTGQTLNAITVTNNVVYTEVGDPGRLSQAIYAGFGSGTHGNHVFENNTIWAADTTKNANESYFWAIRTAGNQQQFTFRDNIVTGAVGLGLVDEDTSGPPLNLPNVQTIEYSNHYGNGTNTDEDNFGQLANKGIGSISIDPLFASLDPNDPNFLYLSPSSPLAVVNGASDGGYIGALPVIPEPATLTLTALGVSLTAFRRRRRA